MASDKTKQVPATKPTPVQHRDKTGKDGYDDRRLTRGLSRTTDNIQIVNRARNTVLHDITEGGEKAAPQFVDTPEFTFTIPDLTQFSDDFRAFLYRDIIEMSTLVSLEQAGRLNWWADIGACQRLLPLATSGDGNCLLHAASLGMWGFHDRMLTLRTALHSTLSNTNCPPSFKRRWKWHQSQLNQQLRLVFNEREWQMEWDNLTRLASTTPRSAQGSSSSCCDSPATKGQDGTPTVDKGSELFYESLEEFHVFVLAHILRRPIIVVADTMLKDTDGEALAPIPFGGIYLPLECDVEDCHSSPLLLTYDAAHFSALVPLSYPATEDNSPDEQPLEPSSTNSSHSSQQSIDLSQSATAIPLVDPHLKLLPVHFLFDPGPDYDWNQETIFNIEVAKKYETVFENRSQLVKQYLVTEEVMVTSSVGISFFENMAAENNQRQRSHSWTGPKSPLKGIMTEPGGQSGSRTLGREGTSSMAKYFGKDKEPTKVSRQMHSMVKSFGSFGKSMGKKFRKNFGSITKAMKQLDTDKKNSSLKTSKNSDSLTYKLTCARLLSKTLDYQGEMVANYLEAAKHRFEHKQRSTNRPNEVVKNNTTTTTTATNGPLSSHPQSSDANRAFQRQDTLINQGNSKFYTLASENHEQKGGGHAEDPLTESSQATLAEGSAQGGATSSRLRTDASDLPHPVQLARSSFYDKSLSHQFNTDASYGSS